jgi:WD40 repeat protein
VAATLSSAGYGYGAFSPDGKLIAIGLSTAEIDVWTLSALSAAPVKLLIDGFTSYGVAFTPDSTRVVSIDDSSLYVHSATTGARLATASIPIYTEALGVSPAIVAGGLGVAVAGAEGFTAVYTLSGQATLNTPVVLDVNPTEVYSAAFSPSGTLLALGDYDAVTHFWTYPVPTASTPETGAQVITDPVLLYQTINGLAFSPNGSYLAVAAGYPGELSIWNVASRSVISRVSIPNENALSVAFSPSGNAVIVGEKGCGKILLCTE